MCPFLSRPAAPRRRVSASRRITSRPRGRAFAWRGAFLPQGPTELVVQRSPTSNGHVIGIPSVVVRAYIAQVRLSGLTPTGDARRPSGESRRPSGEYESPVVTRGDQVLPRFPYA